MTCVVYLSTRVVWFMHHQEAELTAFQGFLKKVIGPIKVHVDNKEKRLWNGEMKCIDPKAGDADLWKNLGRVGEACQSAPHREEEMTHLRSLSLA